MRRKPLAGSNPVLSAKLNDRNLSVFAEGRNTSPIGNRSDTIMFMLVMDFISWWYGQGWKSVFTNFSRRIQGVQDLFSVRQLLRTLFEPWRRIITYSGDSLAEKFRAWGDNAVSRVIGFCVRSIMLFVSLLATLASIILTTLEAIIWPILPIAVPVLIIWGLL